MKAFHTFERVSAVEMEFCIYIQEEQTIMNKPRILVLTAAGRTGMPVVLQLLDEGFPVTAFVHKADQRSERLKAKGADIVVGSLTDINDMRTG